MCVCVFCSVFELAIQSVILMTNTIDCYPNYRASNVFLRLRKTNRDGDNESINVHQTDWKLSEIIIAMDQVH